MIFSGVFKKMQNEFSDPVQYYMDTDSDFIHLNQLIDSKINLQHTGYQCMNCELDKPIFRMGYCRECFFTVPQTASFVLKPEESKAHLGIEDRDLAWEKQVQLQPHIVYLANTGGLKVGVTRKSQVPTRWVDQGADYALPILQVENRYLAGVSEVALAKHISDKTNYRKMLARQAQPIDLQKHRDELIEYLPEETKDSLLHEEPLQINFPVLEYPSKINSVTLSKSPSFEGILKGIKGQYLIFEEGLVFNVRNHEGYAFELQIA